MSEGIDVKNKPSEMDVEFLKDISDIVMTMQDGTDEVMLQATKDVVEAYLRSEIKPQLLDKVYSQVKDVYREKKQGKPNTDLISRLDSFLEHAKKLKKGIDEKTTYFR